MSSEKVSLEIPPKPQFVSLCRLALTAICREHRFTDDDIADLKLAITEACSNSIRHAYDETGEEAATKAVAAAWEAGAARVTRLRPPTGKDLAEAWRANA